MNSNFKSGFDRHQTFFASLDDFIPSDDIARVIDAFVDSLDLSDFKNSIPKLKGNRPISPSTLLKIYLLGYHRNIRSSRKLEHALNFDVEFMWIAHGLKIKHSSIADFRKVNHHLLKPIMLKFNLYLDDFGLLSDLNSTDGTKIKAVNSKDKNFTLNKLDSRIERLKKHIDEFDALFDANEDLETLQFLLDKAMDSNSSKINLESIRDYLVRNNLSQLSLTDPDSKLMPNNGKFEVCYNNQVCVDMKSHIVKDFIISSNPADSGSLASISKEVKNIYNNDVITNTTDKGYYNSKDMLECLENGIIPEVTPQKGQESFILETDYEENEITEEEKQSTQPKDIKKCLKSGVIPSIYKDKISNIEIIEKNIYEDDTDTLNDDNSSMEEQRDFAMEHHCFVRNVNENKVFCPMGEVLRQKSTNSNKIRYWNKLACKNCKNPCTSSQYKTVDFYKFQTISGKSVQKRNKSKKKKTIKKVKFTLSCNRDLLKKRMATSEHPHGSMKFWDHSQYLLLKGREKATGELALYYCAYNIRRATNLLGVDKLVDYFKYIKQIKQKKENITCINSSFSNIFNFFRYFLTGRIFI